MIFFLYGEDTYRSRQKLNEIKERFRKTDKGGVNLVVIDGERTSWANIEKEILSSPFLHDKKLVVVENFFKKRGAKQEELIIFLKTEKTPDSAIVIFWEDGLPDARLASFKLLAKPKQAERFDPLSGLRLNQWIEREVLRQGVKIEKRAVELLSNLVGSDLWRMANEISKLAAYCHGSKTKMNVIAAPDVQGMVQGKFDENIFALTDAIAAKNKRMAFKILNEQIEAGLKETQIFFMLVRQFRLLLQIKEIVAKDYSFLSTSDPNLKSKIAAELKLHPFVIQKTLQQIKNYSIPELKKIYKNLLAIDMKMKRTRTDPRLLLDLFFAQVLS